MNFLRPLQQALDYTPAGLTAQLYTPKKTTPPLLSETPVQCCETSQKPALNAGGEQLTAAARHTETSEIVPLASRDTEQGPGCTEDHSRCPHLPAPHPTVAFTVFLLASV